MRRSDTFFVSSESDKGKGDKEASRGFQTQSKGELGCSPVNKVIAAGRLAGTV